MRRRLVALSVATIAVVAIGGTAFAAGRLVAPAANGKIYSCYKSTGAIRLVNSSTPCPKSEHRLVWNQTGKRGPAGPAGKPPPNGTVHVVGTPGSAAYGDFMQAYGSPDFADLAYYRDADTTVHLSGLACEHGLGQATCQDGVGFAGSTQVFTLPAADRPAKTHVFSATSFGLGKYYPARIDIDAAGVVSVVTPPQAGFAWISFDGISFRAGT